MTEERINDYREGGAGVIHGVLAIARVKRIGQAVDGISANPS